MRAQGSIRQIEAPENSGLEKGNTPAERKEEVVCPEAEKGQASQPASQAGSYQQTRFANTFSGKYLLAG